MGSGKSAVGKRLAARLHRPFHDTDSEIERRTGVDVAYVFEREGEAGFRRRESAVIDDLTKLDDIILATGGGAILDPANRRNLAERGYVIYLEASVEQQFGRTRGIRFPTRNSPAPSVAPMVLNVHSGQASALATSVTCIRTTRLTTPSTTMW